jgi:transcriptional regulator with XRE-family HTH domain
MTDVRIFLARNMKRYREILGISQMKLAEKISCSPTLIGKMETMKRFPSADTINRIAKALKIEPSDLFIKHDDNELLKIMKSHHEQKIILKKKILKALDEF